MYDATVNYGNGIRLLSSSLTIQSKDGHGRLFDHLVLTTQGLGNDPYQSAILRIEKNRLYRYDMSWRLTQYVDPAATVSFGEHAMNTQRTMQDHDFTLFPQRNYQLFLGYSRNLETGPALTTIQLFNSQGDEFPLFANVHREVNEYRLGGEVHFGGMRVNVMHGWEDYKEDAPESLRRSGGKQSHRSQRAHVVSIEPGLSRHQSLLARRPVSRRQKVLGRQRPLHLRRRQAGLRPRRTFRGN